MLPRPWASGGGGRRPSSRTRATILAIDREGQRSVSRFDDSNLIASWRWYSPLWRSINRQEDEYLSMVMDMGEQLGISRQELGLLSRAGYSAWDMEDLLYDDALRACCLADARTELAAW